MLPSKKVIATVFCLLIVYLLWLTYVFLFGKPQNFKKMFVITQPQVLESNFENEFLDLKDFRLRALTFIVNYESYLQEKESLSFFKDKLSKEKEIFDYENDFLSNNNSGDSLGKYSYQQISEDIASREKRINIIQNFIKIQEKNIEGKLEHIDYEYSNLTKAKNSFLEKARVLAKKFPNHNPEIEEIINQVDIFLSKDLEKAKRHYASSGFYGGFWEGAGTGRGNGFAAGELWKRVDTISVIDLNPPS